MPDKPNYFAVGIHYLDYGHMRYADTEGNLIGGTFTAKDILVDVMYARQLGQQFSVGVTLKPIYSIYESYHSFALGADVGAISVYIAMNNEEQDVKKKIMMVVGACIFLVAAAQALPLFFGL